MRSVKVCNYYMILNIRNHTRPTGKLPNPNAVFQDSTTVDHPSVALVLQQSP